jgi:sulfide dehydrogenase cytochrome subunit
MQHRFLALFTVGLFVSAPVGAGNIVNLADTCNNCHGMDGVSVGLTMPSIAGLSEPYLKNLMLQWKSGERYSATMGRLVKGYSDEQIANLARHFSQLPWTPVVQKADATVLAKGKDVTDRCETCHGVTGGQPDDKDTPHLNGQWAKYIEMELMKYREDAVKMPHAKMRKNAQKIGADDVKTAAEYYAAQPK